MSEGRRANPGAMFPAALLAAGCAAAVGAVLAVDWLTGARVNLSILYGILLAAHMWVRRPALLWAQAAASVVATFVVYLADTGVPAEESPFIFINRTLAALAVLVIAAIVHRKVLRFREVEAARETIQRHNRELEAANRELAAREEEVARQNEELQSQAEELERQSEELRVANDELMRRERTLHTLLALSRSLTADLTRGETMQRVCDALTQLLDGPATAAAILEQEGDELAVQCHQGFGPGGVATDRIPLAQSFASLVMTRGRTAYLEDLALRPDLKLPQPKDGQPVVSVLAAPLRVGGWPVGTLELYSTRGTAWSEEQVALLESLAAQTSVSLEAARLFDAVTQERRRLEAILRTVPFGLAVANADASEIRLNPAGAAIFSVPADANLAAEGVYSAVRVVQDGRQLPVEQYPLRRAIREGIDSRNEVELLLPGGRRVALLIHAAPIKDKDGKVTGAVGALVDITAQKELQRELDVRRREAEEASVRKTRFLAAVSHDIRTPANAISLLAELIRRTASNPALAGEVPELAREMQSSALSLVNLLGDVLDVARFDSGRIEVQECEFSLGELLAEEYRRMQPLAREKGLALEYCPPPEPLRVRGDRVKLSRVVGNLLGNAIKFTQEGSVRLNADCADNGRCRIRVSDTGIGIAPEHQRYIFDEFFQLSNPERDRNKGTGLGLAICKRLVDAMGGRLEVQSEPGKGSTFTVTLLTAGVPLQSAAR